MHKISNNVPQMLQREQFAMREISFSEGSCSSPRSKTCPQALRKCHPSIQSTTLLEGVKLEERYKICSEFGGNQKYRIPRFRKRGKGSVDAKLLFTSDVLAKI